MSRACWNCGGSGVRCCEYGADRAPTRYAAGDRVVYFQPGVDAILASWSGSRLRGPADGDEVTVTITGAKTASGTAYYDTDAGVVLTDDDILRVAS